MPASEPDADTLKAETAQYPDSIKKKKELRAENTRLPEQLEQGGQEQGFRLQHSRRTALQH